MNEVCLCICSLAVALSGLGLNILYGLVSVIGELSGVMSGD